MEPLHGKFIVLDGTEGCGKSTQAKMLRQRIVNEPSMGLCEADITAVRDPGTTVIGEKVRAILLDPASLEMAMRCEMLLYMAARSQMMSQTIAPALRAGKLVLCDRFVSSTLAYQFAGEGLSAEEIRAVANVAIRGRWPDLTILLDMSAEASLGRVRRVKDRIEERPLSYHEQVRRNYLAQAADDPAKYKVIDADRPPEAVHEDIWTAITGAFFLK